MEMEPDDELPDPLDDDGDPLGFDLEDEGGASSHSDSVFVVDDEEAPRESFLESDSHALDELIERTSFFTDEVAYVDADPKALDAAAGIRAEVEQLPVPEPLPEPVGPSEAELAEQAEKAAAARRHLRGLVEALLFVTDRPMKAADIADVARAEIKEVRSVLEELSEEYRENQRGFQLDELAGGWQLRTSAAYAPFVREVTQAKPVRLSRAQVETLAIIAYRQPITRPEIEDIRGVDAGAVLKLLLDRDMVRILGKKDEPGRPLLYGTTGHFLTFFGLKSLKDLPTLREFTELTDESREVVERELGEVLPDGPHEPPPAVASVVSETVVTETVVTETIVTETVVEERDTQEQQVVVEEHEPEAPDSEEARVTDPGDQPEPENDTDEAPDSHKPGGSTYDPSDEELFPDDEDEDDDEEDDEDEDE